MFNYKKFSLPKIFTIFFSYPTNKTEPPCANSRYSQCLNCFSYLLPAVVVPLNLCCQGCVFGILLRRKIFIFIVAAQKVADSDGEEKEEEKALKAGEEKAAVEKAGEEKAGEEKAEEE